MSLVSRMALAAAAVSIATLLVVGGSAYFVGRQQTIQVGHHLNAAKAQANALRVDLRIRAAADLVRRLSENLVIRNALLDSEGRRAYLEPFLDSIASIDGRRVAVAVLDFSGQPIMVAGVPYPGWSENRRWFANQVSAGKAGVLVVANARDVTEVVLAYPLLFPTTNSSEGLLAVRITAPDLLATAESTGPSTRIVTSSEGLTDPFGDEVEVAFTIPIDSETIALAVATQTDQGLTDATLQKLRDTVILFGISVAVLVVLASVFGAHRAILPLQNMTATVRRIMSTDSPYPSLEDSGPREIRNLTRSFNEMFGRLRQSAEAERRGTEERYQAIVNSTINTIITIDDQGIVQSFNPAAEQLFGHAAGDVVGKCVSMLMPPGPRKQHDDYLSIHGASGLTRALGSVQEVTAMRRDGTQFPAELSVSRFVFNGRLLFTGVIRDLTELRRAEAVKREFIATVSHELRTPLAGIMGYVGLLLEGESGPLSLEQTEFLTIVSTETDRLRSLIDDLLHIERLENGTLHMVRSPVDLGDILGEVDQAFHAAAERKGLALIVETGVDLLVSADRSRLTQVFFNLVSNAIKYTKSGSIALKAMRSRDAVRISISDTGIGMAPEFVASLFGKFHRADDEYTQAAGGTGLGLAIAKGIIEGHDGQIHASSTQGVGSEFVVVLPALSENAGLSEDSASSGHLVPLIAP